VKRRQRAIRGQQEEAIDLGDREQQTVEGIGEIDVELGSPSVQRGQRGDVSEGSTRLGGDAVGYNHPTFPAPALRCHPIPAGGTAR
jgi:hypothetical protein